MGVSGDMHINDGDIARKLDSIKFVAVATISQASAP